MSRIATLGAGKVGSAISRLALAAGYEVLISDTLPAEEVRHHVEENVAGATVATAQDAVRSADMVVLAVPLHAYQGVEPSLLEGRVVVDLTNHWASVDGEMDDFENAPSVSEALAEHFRDARWVKTLNHIACRDMEGDAHPKGSAGRRALAVASDDRSAAEVAMGFLDDIGFDPVYSGPLETGRLFEPGTPIFNGSFTAEELTTQLKEDGLA